MVEMRCFEDVIVEQEVILCIQIWDVYQFARDYPVYALGHP